MQKITKTQAVAHLKRGSKVTIYRDKVNPDNHLGLGVARVHQDDLLKTAYVANSDYGLTATKRIQARLNRFINSFEYYNSDRELGTKTYYAI
jgi:hypothetical protein